MPKNESKKLSSKPLRQKRQTTVKSEALKQRKRKKQLKKGVISKERFAEWVQLPITQELIAHCEREENAWRSALGAGAGVRGETLQEAGTNALIMCSKADCFRTMAQELSVYASIIGVEKQEPEDGQETLEEGDGEGLAQAGRGWSSFARSAIRGGEQQRNQYRFTEENEG